MECPINNRDIFVRQHGNGRHRWCNGFNHVGHFFQTRKKFFSARSEKVLPQGRMCGGETLEPSVQLATVVPIAPLP
jgi:hypothetical protein